MILLYVSPPVVSGAWQASSLGNLVGAVGFEPTNRSLVRRNNAGILSSYKGGLINLTCENHALRCPGVPGEVRTVVPVSGSRSSAGIAFIESSDAEPVTLERGSGHDGALAVLRSSAARTPATVRVEPWLLRKVSAGHIRQSDASRMPIRRSRAAWSDDRCIWDQGYHSRAVR
jgi:hypothetical protein